MFLGEIQKLLNQLIHQCFLNRIVNVDKRFRDRSDAPRKDINETATILISLKRFLCKIKSNDEKKEKIFLNRKIDLRLIE